jgi:23S rRNA (guanosine2251-2'-O)-methyltransferase
VKFIQVTNLGKTLAAMKQQEVKVVGTLLDDTALPIQSCDLTGRLVVVMGAEDTGIRPINQAQCDEKIYIPMSGDLQSLNVSVATGMALYEVCRQRLAKV